MPVISITKGANFTQIKEPARAKTAITIAVDIADRPKCSISVKITAGGNEPNVPGQSGSRPRPKHDVSNLFIFFKRECKNQKLRIKIVESGT